MGGEQVLDPLGIAEIGRQQRRADAGDAAAVRHEVPNLDGLLAGGAEGGPVAGDRLVEIEQPALDELQHDAGEQALGAGEHAEQAVSGPAPARGDLATPQIEHRPTQMGNREGSADIAAFGEIARELLGHRLETGRHEPLRAGGSRLPVHGWRHGHDRG